MDRWGASSSSNEPAGILLRRAKGEAPSVLIAGSLAIVSVAGGSLYPYKGAGVGTARSCPASTSRTRTLWAALDTCLASRRARVTPRRRRLVGTPRLAALVPGRPSVRRAPGALETLRRRYAPPRRTTRATVLADRRRRPRDPYSLPISYPRVSTMRSGSADEPPSEK